MFKTEVKKIQRWQKLPKNNLKEFCFFSKKFAHKILWIFLMHFNSLPMMKIFDAKKSI